ncbi:MAG: ThuA domain-containing protein [Phycisphaerae bacterium]|nr:ThuA domain-containing protein [Phycisphaerae bacterium]
MENCFKLITAAVISLMILNTATFAEITPEEIAKITSAAPSKAPAKPKTARKLLVFNLCEGFAHSSIPYVAKALEIMGEKTGAYTTVISDKMEVFRPEYLRQFDAVCFNSTTRLSFKDPALRKSLMDFIKGGKGIVGIHGATDNFYTWPEAAEMMGGTFDGHPWGGGGTWAVQIEDPTHPLMASFKGKGFKVNDEIYRTKTINLRDNARVLMGLDLTDQTTGSANGIKPSDVDIAISWVKNYGKGRMFYCSLGHNHHLTWTPSVLEHYLAGIQFAMGDFPVDVTPLPFKAKPKYDITALVDDIIHYDYGQSRKSLMAMNEAIRDAKTAQDRLGLEKALWKVLSADNATMAGKMFACRKLREIGTEQSAVPLAGLLLDPKTSDMARYALESIEGKAVDTVLIMALKQLDGDAKIGVINTIGRRGDQGEPVMVLAGLVNGQKEMADAAVTALGKIGGPVALSALLKAKDSAKGDLKNAILDTCLICADDMAKKGHNKQANRLYQLFASTDNPINIRKAALRGMIMSSEDSQAEIIKGLRADDEVLQLIAISMLNTVDGSQVAIAAANELQRLSPPMKVKLLSALGERGDQAVGLVVMEALKDADKAVQVAAIMALVNVGGPNTVIPLAKRAATSSGDEQKVARNTLYRLKGKAVDDVITESIMSTQGDVKAELIKSVNNRNISDAVLVLLIVASDATDNNISREVHSAIQKVANPEMLPALISLLIQGKVSSRSDMEKTIVAVSKKENDSDRQVAPILAALPKVDNQNDKVSLLMVLGKLGNNNALPVLRAALKDSDPITKTSVIRALAGWPNAGPMEDLFLVAKNDSSANNQIVALRGYIKMATYPSERSSAESVEKLSQAMALANRSEEKRAVLAALPSLASKEALALAEKSLSVTSLQSEAKLAVEKIKKIIAGSKIKVSASLNNNNANLAIDGKMETRWDTGTPMKPGMWFQVDLGFANTVNSMTLDAKGSAMDYPQGYKVYASNDGENWGDPIAAGKGESAVLKIDFKQPVNSRFFKIEQTGSSDDKYWSIHEMTIGF